jgi:hypothetical protein
MIYVLSMVTLIVAAVLSLRTTHSRETRLVLSTTIARPASVVFSVIGAMERAPVWRRRPVWLPSPLRITLMTPWGEFAQAKTRKSGIGPKGPEEIWVRHLKNREFGYRSVRRHDLSFESTFRLAPEEGKCLLTWEIRYRVHRLPDILGKSAIEAGARASMANSLELIQRFALGYPDTVSTRDLIYEARRDQISAA